MRELTVRGIGWWSPGVADWPSAGAALADGTTWPAAPAARPAPGLMPANERRRAPDSVLLALTVAEQACAAAGADPRILPSVFASTYGDLAISDYMCATLADDPAQLSPTRFHNSVHNAPSGYWSIATGAMAPTTSLCGYRATLAAGLLEAATQIGDTGDSILLAAYDIAGAGPMAEVVASSLPFGCAFVLCADGVGPRLRLVTRTVTDGVPAAGDPGIGDAPAGLAELRTRNPIAADALPLLMALGRATPMRYALPLSAGLELAIEVRP